MNALGREQLIELVGKIMRADAKDESELNDMVQLFLSNVPTPKRRT